MAAYRRRDGLERTATMIASIQYEVKQIEHRLRVATFNLSFFGALFLTLVIGETLFAMMMFAIIQIEILGVVFSGAAFAMLVPTVIGAAHVKVHHEADHFTKWWLKKLSSIGILVFALGVSLMVGYSAWLAAQDAIAVFDFGSTGTIGGEQVGGADEGSSGIAGWIGMIPNSQLFLGLAFGMIINISFASFCLGRALEAFNILTLTPRVGKEVTALVDGLTAKIAAFRKESDAIEDMSAKLPFDVKSKFAREAANAGWKIVQVKLAAARRKFARDADPLIETTPDPEAETIAPGFTSEDAFTRHLADQMDVLRMHNVLRVLTGLTQPEKD
ncbi:hypothetical protein [Neoaquamicrobium sediminum]|uniref:hypothetical protein n=1 Tax=Neoaquamicrobium sediminum TaxID=1849104 RepID=UPI003BA9B5DF